MLVKVHHALLQRAYLSDSIYSTPRNLFNWCPMYTKRR